MAGRTTCQKEGTHACADTLSHFVRSPWVIEVDYPAYCDPLQSPSALPPRHAAVMGILAAFRPMALDELCREAGRLVAGMLDEFAKRWWAALAAIPPGARARIMGKLRLVRALEEDDLYDHANEVYRQIYRRLGLEADVRGLEEVAEALNAALRERLAGGQMCGGRLRLFRFAGLREAGHVAESGLLAHGGGQGHLSWSLRKNTRFSKRPMMLSLGLTSNVAGSLITVAYRSPAFSAPGSRPAHPEQWRGTKSWEAIRECEVRLRTPVPVHGLDLAIRLREPVNDVQARSLRRLCGRRKALVARSWPPGL